MRRAWILVLLGAALLIVLGGDALYVHAPQYHVVETVVQILAGLVMLLIGLIELMPQTGAQSPMEDEVDTEGATDMTAATAWLKLWAYMPVAAIQLSGLLWLLVLLMSSDAEGTLGGILTDQLSLVHLALVTVVFNMYLLWRMIERARNFWPFWPQRPPKGED